MYLTGYHGTTLENAYKILSEGKFNASDNDTDWLGKGIYFYFDFNDAINWRNADAVLHSVIKIDHSEYLDIDSNQGKKIYEQIVDIIASLQEKEVSTSSKNTQKNQCAVMRMIWETYPKVSVISASFPTEKTKMRTMIDVRKRRKEFCVRNNRFIKCTQIIRKDDIND